jgi:hypothetical protein
VTPEVFNIQAECLTEIHHIIECADMDPPHHMMLNRRSSSSPIDVHTHGRTSKIHHADIPDTCIILQVASNPPSFSQGDFSLITFHFRGKVIHPPRSISIDNLLPSQLRIAVQHDDLARLRTYESRYLDPTNRRESHQLALRIFFVSKMTEPKALAPRYPSSTTPYQKFVEGPAKSFFKSLFLGTKLGQALRIMSMSKTVPKGLKSQECEKGNQKKRPPIPYVPVVNEVQEAVAKGKEYTYKIKLPDKTKFSVPIWDTGTQEAFLIHVQQAKSASKRKGLFQDYDDAIEAESKAVERAKNLRKGHCKRDRP